MAKAKVLSSMVIGPVLLSYPNLFTPKAAGEDSDRLLYSAKLVIKKSQKELIQEIMATMKRTAAANKDVFKGKAIGGPGFKWALRDADKEKETDGKDHGPECKNSFFINATSSTAPGVVGPNKKPLMDQNDIYAGCQVYASVNFFCYNKKGNWGVSCGLNNILKFKDGDRLSGKPSAESDFKDLDIEVDEEEYDLLTEDVDFDENDLLG